MPASEFAAFVKGWEYIIAIAAVVTFVGFWRLLMVRPRTGEPVWQEDVSGGDGSADSAPGSDGAVKEGVAN